MKKKSSSFNRSNEKKEALQEDIQWKKRFELVAEASGQIVYDYCADDGTIRWSGSIEKVLGYRLSEMNGGIKQWEKLIHKDDRRRAIKLLEDAERDMVPYEVEYRYKHKDGHYVEILDRGFFISSEDRKCKSMVGMMQDISATRRSGKLIGALNSAMKEIQKVITPEEIFKVVARELKKMDIESIVLLTDEKKEKLVFKYYSYDSVLMKAAEKVAGMRVTKAILSIKDVKEYSDVIDKKKTLLVNSNVEFIRNILPKKVKFLAEYITKTFKISRFIMAPLVVEDKIFGTFSVQADDLLESDIPAVTLFAQQLSGAWHKGELIERIQHDMIIQKQTERALTENEQKFRTIVEQLSEGFALMNEKGIIIEWNKSIERITGRKREEVINSYFWDIQSRHLVPEKRNEKEYKQLKKIIEKSLRDKDSAVFNKTYEIPLLDTGGEERIIQSTLFPLLLGDRFYVGSISRDITEKIKVEKALQESEELFRKVFEVSPMGMVMSDGDSNFTKVNEVSCKMLGYTEEEIKSKKYLDVTHPDYPDLESEIDIVRKIKTGEIPYYKAEKPYLTKNKETVWGALTLSSIRDRNGKFLYFLAMIEDVTERKKAETENVLLAQTLKSVKDAISITDMNGRIIYVNNSFLKTYGYTEEEVTGKSVSLLRPEEYSELSELIHRKTMEGGWYSELINIRKDGTEFPVELWTSTVTDAKNKIIAYVGVARDITERKRAEEALKQSENRLRTLFEAMDDVILVVDSEGRYIEIAPTNPSLLYKPANELIGKTVHEIFPKEKADFFLESIKKALRESSSISFEYTIPIDGREYWFTATLSPLTKDSALLVARDITKKKQTESELFEKSKELDRYFTSSLDLLCIADTDGYFRRLNPEWERILGYTMEELFERKFLDFIHKDDLESTIEAINTLSDQKEILNFVNRFRCKDGTYRWLEWRSYPEGKLIYAVARDITESINTKKALQESEEKMQSIFRVAPTGIGMVTRNRIILDVNKRICEMTGYKREELIGKNARILYPTQEDFDYVGTEKHRQIQEKGTGLVETRWLRKDGKIIDIILASTPIDTKDVSRGLIFTALDITRRKKTEENLIKSEERFEQVVENADEWVWEVNAEGLFTYASPVVEKILGYRPDELVNKKHFYDLVIPEAREEIKSAAFKTFREKGKIKGFINKNLHKNGKIIVLETNGVPILDNKNKLFGFRGVDKDITERMRAEEELINAKERAEEMNRVKSSFLANMSHEVRTPLVAILGFSEVLKEAVKEEELKNYADMIHKGGERLLETLNLILDLSVIEAQKVKIELFPLEITGEVNEIVSFFEKAASRKSLKIKTESDANNIIINLDIKIFRQIMNNLINNAIKYTKSGEITIKINKEEKGGKSYGAIRVKDTGIGIPKDKQDLIWEEFRQVSEGFNRSFEGTGLGLSITKKFVEKLGGEIFLEKSEVGVGSVFTVLFPIEEATKEIRIPGEDGSYKIELGEFRRKKMPDILYVEDDPVAIDIVRAFTKDYCTIEGALSGKEGIEKAKEKRYDAVLMDINLGKDMDGLEATEKIRKIQVYKDIPIIAVTAFAMVGDRDEFFERGCTHYISKPFSRTELQRLIMEVFAAKKQD